MLTHHCIGSIDTSGDATLALVRQSYMLGACGRASQQRQQQFPLMHAVNESGRGDELVDMASASFGGLDAVALDVVQSSAQEMEPPSACPQQVHAEAAREQKLGVDVREGEHPWHVC